MPSCSQQDFESFIEDIEKYDKVFYKSLATNDHKWISDKIFFRRFL